jgi:autotransporter-associated beta strand protein
MSNSDSIAKTAAARRAARLFGPLGLLATASFVALIPPNEAQASCNVIGSGTLSNLNAGDIANCTGVTTGVAIGTTSNNVAAGISNPGSNLDFSSIQLTTNGNEFYQGLGTTSSDITVILGTASNVLFQDSTVANNLTLSMVDGQFSLSDSAVVTVDVGDLQFGGAGAGSSNISIDGTLNSNSNGQYLINGLGGAQSVFVSGTLNGPSDGLLVSMGDDNDTLQISSSATITGGNSSTRMFDGGAGADTLTLASITGDPLTLDVNSVGIERLETTGAGGSFTLFGTHQFDIIQIGNNTSLQVFDIASLGSPTAFVSLLGSNAALELNFSSIATQDFSQSLFGAGEVWLLNSSNVAFTGDNSNFTGVVNIETAALLSVRNTQTVGGASFINNGLLYMDAAGGLPSLTVAGDISGSGDVEVRANTIATLSGNNTYTGDTIIRSTGALQIEGSNSIGSGAVYIDPDAALIVNNTADSVLSNLLTGAGELIMNGSATTDVTGTTNNYSGGTTINSGALRVTDLGALGTGPIHANAGGSLIFDATGTTVIGTLMTGDGAFVKEGAGDVIMNAANTFTGGTIIESGRVGMNNGQGLGTGDIQVNAGAILGIGNVALDNDVSGGGIIIKTASGDATLNGVNTHTGGIDIQDGRIFADSAANLGTGNINIVTGSSLVFGGSATQTIANTFSGGGTFRMDGTGQISFSSPFTLGGLEIIDGRVNINTIGTTNASVSAGAVLGGSGTIVGNVTNDGTVAPGNSIGTLTVQGNYVHNSNAVLEIEFDAFGGIDLLDITGTATINGGTVRFISIGGAEGMGGTFLNADGGVTGTFATVDTVGALFPITVIYEPTSAGMAPTLLSARPSTFNAQILSAADTSFGFIDRVSANAVAPEERARLWGEGFTSSAERSGDGETLGYAHDSSGVSTGMSVRATDALTIGGAIAFTDSDIALSENGGDGEQEGVLFSLYGNYEIGGWSFLVGGLTGGIDQTTTRNVNFSGLSASIDGETSSSVSGAFVGVSRAFGEIADWSLRGSARASIISQTQDAYTEDGASPLRLAVEEVDVETVEAQAGLTAMRTFVFNDRDLSVRFGAGVRHLELEGAEIPVSFVLSGADLVLEGDARDSTDGYFEAGGAYALTDAITLSAGYSGQGGDTERHEARVGLAVQF